MRKVFGQMGRALPGLSALLLVAACDGTSTPVSPSGAGMGTGATGTSATAAASAATIIVRGMVVDASDRPIGDANVECPAEVSCTPPGVTAGGHEHRAATTNAEGFYEVVATGTPASGAFLMNANRQGYQVEWREVKWPDPTCSWDRTGCSLTVNFSLKPIDQ